MLALFNYGLLSSLLLAEASWLFLVFGLLGALFGVFHPVVPWVGLLLLLIPGCLVQRLMIFSEWSQHRSKQFHVLMIGLMTVYVIVSYSSGLSWPMDLITWRTGTNASLKIFLFIGIGILMWRRGLWIGGQEDPGHPLKTIFPIGFILAIVGAIIEAISGLRLGFTPVTFILFGACLSGLALSQLIKPKDSSKNSWRYTPIWAVATVLISGVLFILLSQTPVAVLALTFLEALLDLLQFILALIMIPVEYLLRGIFAIMTLFINWFGGEQDAQLTSVTQFTLEGSRDPQDEPSTFWFILSQILSWLFIFLFISMIIGFLYLVLWVRLKNRFRDLKDEESNPQREIISFVGIEHGDGLLGKNPITNLQSTYHRLPDGADPSNQVIRAYYELLNFGIKQGKPRLQKSTPIEYQPELMDLIEDHRVNQFTSQFNNTYYGLITPEVEIANEMEENVQLILRRITHKD